MGSLMPSLLIRHYLAIAVLLAPAGAFAGGPLVVGGPSFGRDAVPFLWNPAKMPIRYTVDSGPLATGTINVDNATGLQRVQGMFNVWSSVPTAAISYSYAGPVLNSSGTSAGDVTTAAQYNDVVGTCKAGTQSPIIFDADGSLMSGLGVDVDVIGFAGPCALNSQTGYIDSAHAVLNGSFLAKGTLNTGLFNTAITHELGHFSGLGHSQINVNVLNEQACTADETAGIPLMFPILACARPLDANNNPILAPDDAAWIAHLYPSATTPNQYGVVSGAVVFDDGVTPAQGVNVILRAVDDPNTAPEESRRVAFSAVSGYLFTGNPGQSVTGNNNGGFSDGSRTGKWIGYFEIPALPGKYTLEIESVDSAFGGGSSVGSLDPPVPIAQAKFWKSNGSGVDQPLERDTITLAAGQNLTNIVIIENGSLSTFDYFEDPGLLTFSAADDLTPRFAEKAGR